MTVNILRAAHAELRVTDLDRAHAFYVDALGFIEIERSRDRLYLGCLEERDKYSLILRQAESGGLGHLAFRVASEDDLERLAKLFTDQGLSIRWVEAHTLEPYQGRALRVQDPAGIPLEFFHQIERRERLLQRFDLYRGAHVMRIDHFNVMVTDVQAMHDWMTQHLGFKSSEYTVSGEEGNEKLWGSWLYRKPTVHDVALTNGAGPRLHHIGFFAQDKESILRVCDILAAKQLDPAIERGPGRHGLSNAFFLYLRDPDHNRIELYANDYLITDPDHEPIKWHLDDRQRATFWGRFAPPSWFEEAVLVEDIHTGELLPTQPPLLVAKPAAVD